MKRRILFLVTILLTVSALAHAETFQLHSGVQFGMSMDEVKKLEIDAGYDVKEWTNSLYLDEIGEIDCLRLSWIPNLAGVGGAIEYQFDRNSQKLNLCIYSLSGSLTNSEMDQLVNAYTKKYGQVISDGNDFFDIPGSAYDAYDIYLEEANSILTKELQVKAFYQWLSPLENGGAVDIQMIAMRQSYQKVWGQAQWPDSNSLYVTYSYRSPDEMKLIYSEMQEKEDARNADI